MDVLTDEQRLRSHTNFIFQIQRLFLWRRYAATLIFSIDQTCDLLISFQKYLYIGNPATGSCVSIVRSVVDNTRRVEEVTLLGKIMMADDSVNNLESWRRSLSRGLVS